MLKKVMGMFRIAIQFQVWILALLVLALPIQNSIAEQAGAARLALEEVVVTAQKRAQSTQDLGIAVAALSGDAMKDMGIDQAEDLANFIPNVSALNVSGGGVPILIIRGVGLQNFRVNDSPTTAFYIDEVYQTSVVSAGATMFDLERVELLKGPQGGLYGRNTISGAMQVISKRPEIGGNGDGSIKVGYGEFSEKQVDIASDIAISDIAAARISGRWVNSDDSDVRSLSNNFSHGEQDRWAARLMVDVTPSNATELRLKLHGGKDKSELPLTRAVGVYADIGAGAPNIAAGALSREYCASILAGNGSDPQTCATDTGLTPAEYGLSDSDSGRFDSAADFPSFLNNDWIGASLIANFEMGDYSLSSISAYETTDYQRFADLDATPIEATHINYQTELSAWSQEFRLFYSGSEDFTWVLGINYAEDELDENTLLLGGDGALPVFFGGAVALTQIYDQETEALAVYGHGEWSFADAWNLVGELRYTDVDKSFAGEERFVAPDASTSPFLAADDSASFDAYSGKLALEWAPTDDILLYGSLSRGFKTGGFFGGFVTNPAQFEPYDEETVLAYELGIKSDLLDGRLRANASAFFYDREDVQQSASDPRGAVTVNRLTNVGDVEVSGVEVDLTWLVAESIRLQMGLGYTDSEIVDSELEASTLPRSAGNPIEGTNTPNYSRFSGNLMAQYERAVSENLLARAQLEYSYRSARDLNLVTTPVEAGFLEQSGYGLANLRLSIGPEDGQWSAMVFVENINDKSYRTQVRSNGLIGAYELYGDPRTWGVSFTYKWGGS